MTTDEQVKADAFEESFLRFWAGEGERILTGVTDVLQRQVIKMACRLAHVDGYVAGQKATRETAVAAMGEGG